MREGLVLVDKPAGPTSHDVVGMVRRIFGTRKVGHAGTLDPMATGMLVVGVGRATRLLGYLGATDKEYVATIRLGVATTTDDAQGQPLGRPSDVRLTDSDVHSALQQFTGTIQQRPSSVSAIKVDGKRAHALVRAGHDIELAARTVDIGELAVLGVKRVDGFVDVDVRVTCSAGTYVRAIARDVGQLLCTGGHLTSLRRTRSGSFSDMVALDLLQQHPVCISLSDSVRAAFPVVTLDEAQSMRARHGVVLPAPDGAQAGCPIGVFDSRGDVIGLSTVTSDMLKPVLVFAAEVT